MSRLPRVVSRNGEATVYTYDAVGNRISKNENGEKTEYAYNSRNQLVKETSAAGTVTYSYDANGNLLKQSGGTDTIYTYDVYNRLTAYQKGEQKESYTYDAEGVRRSKTTGTDSIYFVSDTAGDLSQTLAETDGRGNVKAEYTRAGSLTAQVRAGEVSYYLYDGHGDVRALLNEAGRITDKYRYNAYGELLEKEGDTENHYLYTGEYYDGTSNLYYLRARYMNPSTGVFISMDTYEGSIYDPDTLHKYLYANGNPVTYSDPSGNFASAVGGLVATTINTVMNNFQTLNAMGIISGLTNSAITAFLGGSDMEIGEAFFKGYVTGFGLGAVLYVAAAYDVIVFAKMYLMISASNVSMSIVMTIASVIEKKERETLVYGTLAILSLFTLADAYNFNCMVNVIGDKGSASIGWEYNNSEIQGNNTTGTKPDTTRINLAKGRTRFTPTRANGNPVSAGMEHVEKGHFNRPVGNSRSVFTISIDELKAILQRKDIINCAVSDMGGGQYVRIVNTHRVVGNTELKYGGEETTWIEIITDVKGNIITTYPVPEP